MPTAAPATIIDGFSQALTLKKAVSYLRVSTRDQASRGGGDSEGFSIPAQREANRRKASAMGAMVVKEFVDRGASARSANRPELQAMLEYLNEHDIDYVIVHKLDRLARSRADDVAITAAIDASKVRLVSTTESIDESPSGMLLHGIMSSIAEFYSRNLAAEVVKGMSQKARSGGTNGRAPLGYRNHRAIDSEGREVRTVVVDPDRAPLITRAFTEYATGKWTISTLTHHLTLQGLTTLATPKLPSKPISESLLGKILVNPYYKGFVKFQGAYHPGRHQPLIDDQTWDEVQRILAAHAAGERTRRHPHFLKSSLYCGNCGERMLVQMSTAKSGDIYPYFMCAGRHSRRTSCTQKSVLIYEVEKKIAEHYGTVRIEHKVRELVEQAIRTELAAARVTAESQERHIKTERDKLERQRTKLMEAHYAGAVPLELLASEQERITRALKQLDSQSHAATARYDDVDTSLTIALDLLEQCQTTYNAAPEHLKRQLNQALFEKFLVVRSQEGPEQMTITSELRAPFDSIVALARLAAVDAQVDSTGNKKVETSRSLLSRNRVELRGFEPLTFSLRTRRATNCAIAPCPLRSVI